ncbi:MAG: type II secretion system F family protein [Pseudomonadota bacterium]
MVLPLQADPIPGAEIAPGPDQTGLISRLWQALEDSYGTAGPFYAVIVLGVLLVLIFLPFLMRKQKDPLARFSFRDERLDDELVRLRENSDDGSLQKLAPYLEPSDQEQLSATRTDLRAAGYKSRSAVRVYFFAKAAMGLTLLLGALVLTLLVPEEPDITFSIILSCVIGLFGYFLPIYWVKRQGAVRQESIQNHFPDAMDMMLVCIEGGQSLDQAMARVGEEMATSSSPLSEELQIVTYEFRAGKDRSSVLRDFAERCNVNDISSFVTVLIQSQQFGTSVAQALRVYAAEMRDKRLMRAEEKANVLPTKLTLGTMMFTVPPLILILVGPSFIMIVRSLAGFG